jgi:CBS domain-containing protein
MHETVERPAEIVAINYNATIKAAANKMLANKIGCLIVNDENGKFAGIVTERDIVSRVVASSLDLEKTSVAEIMTSQVVGCPVGTPTSKAREIMASNRIRHLPIIDNDFVIGILSARDLMGQQLLEDRAAAEEVAMLSNCLKSIELKEAADAVTKEVPKLFQAGNCVLCLFHEDTDCNDETEKENPAIVSYNKCLCPKEHLLIPANIGRNNNTEKQATINKKQTLNITDQASRIYDSIPEVCEKLGAQRPRLVIPLFVPSRASNENKQLSGYLCMCALSPSSTMNRELTSYKAKLTREILNSHLTNASLYQQARLTSLTDALTGTGSRKLLEDKLPLLS